jgi:hypothetical protein
MHSWCLKSTVADVTPDGIAIQAAGTELPHRVKPYYLGALLVKIKDAAAKVAFSVIEGETEAGAYPTVDAEVEQVVWKGDCPFGAGDQDLNEILISFPEPVYITKKLWAICGVNDDIEIIPFEALGTMRAALHEN